MNNKYYPHPDELAAPVAVAWRYGFTERTYQKEHMKLMTKAALVVLALGTSAAFIIAQDNNNASSNGSQAQTGAPSGGPGMRRHRPPPIIAALDANHDGVIDETEIANASAALRTLDKNGDGKLTMDELMGPRLMGGGGPGAHQGPPPSADGDAPPPPPPGGN